ncbi:MAG: hypothetical protein D4R45_04505 [Planctomycetaceae bacterium]|nr:MAG: hypothetical protein D4R45_04505 [Planctomycetaceae bacterium]
MKHRDPTYQLLKAYQNLLSGHIIDEGVEIYVGTRVPRGQTKYVYLYVQAVTPNNTGDKVIYNIDIAFQAVCIQAVSEGDETSVNNIIDQILQIASEGEDSIIMNGFKCVMSFLLGIDPQTELVDSAYNIIKTLTMSHFIEQT